MGVTGLATGGVPWFMFHLRPEAPAVRQSKGLIIVSGTMPLFFVPSYNTVLVSQSVAPPGLGSPGRSLATGLRPWQDASAPAGAYVSSPLTQGKVAPTDDIGSHLKTNLETQP